MWTCNTVSLVVYCWLLFFSSFVLRVCGFVHMFFKELSKLCVPHNRVVRHLFKNFFNSFSCARTVVFKNSFVQAPWPSGNKSCGSVDSSFLYGFIPTIELVQSSPSSPVYEGSPIGNKTRRVISTDGMQLVSHPKTVLVMTNSRLRVPGRSCVLRNELQYVK